LILFEFIGAVLTVAFWIVVVYAAARIVRRGVRVLETYEAGRGRPSHRRDRGADADSRIV
jgi:hypothetical protein